MTILKTEQLLLRPYEHGDLELLVKFYGTPEVMAIRKLGVLSPDQVKAELQNLLEHWLNNGFGLWAIFERESEYFAGECGLRRLECEAEIELSFGLQPSFQKRGLATEAARAVVHHGFQVLHLSRIIARARADNPASHRVFEKLGMNFEREMNFNSGKVVQYALQRAN
ncbi:MAG: GNAT family N-acetyltransferase [SAR324 cluster bacterium]|nr:GNAT family N-acetyltransferase [SAR324 cluster bacterium]